MRPLAGVRDRSLKYRNYSTEDLGTVFYGVRGGIDPLGENQAKTTSVGRKLLELQRSLEVKSLQRHA